MFFIGGFFRSPGIGVGFPFAAYLDRNGVPVQFFLAGYFRDRQYLFFRGKQVGVTFIQPDAFLKETDWEDFVAPAIRSGVDTNILFTDVSDAALNVPVMVRDNNAVTDLIGGDTFQRYGVFPDGFQRESVSLLLVHGPEDGGDLIPFERQTGF